MNCHEKTNRGGMEPAKVLCQKGLADYAEGAIVSKTLLENPGGTLTWFAFAAGQGLSEHSAPFDALVQVLDGEVEITIGGTPHKLKEGQMILMPANVPHGLKALSNFKMLLTMFKKSCENK